MTKQKIPATPSIKRLPSYLTLIRQAKEEGKEYISGTAIANELHLEPIQVRKDLAITTIIGKPKCGYPVDELIDAIERFLGWNKQRNAVIVGAGNLATALTGYPGFKLHKLNFVAAFDTSKDKIGTSIHSVPVYALSDFCSKVHELEATIAVLTVPYEYAQDCADLFEAAGIKAVWNFTNRKLKLPDSIVCQKEDLSSGFAMLCVMMNDAENAD